MKKILMLGASHFQIPAIKYAKQAGYSVITVDYKPSNPGHVFADEYYNISTVDTEKVLELSERLNIDGILSYASDPGSPTAAFVAEKLGLPGNPYNSVKILQRKDLFRKFLKENGFNVPESDSFENIQRAWPFAEKLLKSTDVIVKPVDSSGSKGVRRISKMKDFKTAFNDAKSFSIKGKVVVEQFIEKRSYQMDGDGFVWNKELVFSCFGSQHNDLECNPHVPVGISFPYIGSEEIQNKAKEQVNQIMKLLDMKVGGLNIEFIVDEEDKIYIIEIGPRSGGNLIPQVIKYSTGVDLVAYAVEGALGKDCSDLKQIAAEGFYASYILHARQSGVVEQILIKNDISSHILEENVLIKTGDRVNKFEGSQHTLGSFLMKFDDQPQMIHLLDNMHEKIEVVVN